MLDGKLDAQIDQVARVLDMRSACGARTLVPACPPLPPPPPPDPALAPRGRSAEGGKVEHAVTQWCDSLGALREALVGAMP